MITTEVTETQSNEADSLCASAFSVVKVSKDWKTGF
jgi:hypothetical protein